MSSLTWAFFVLSSVGMATHDPTIKTIKGGGLTMG